MRGELELRCWCSKHTLLGVCGRDAKTGDPYVWIKIYKQGKVFGEIVAVGGTTRIRCRDCQRWSIIRVHTKVEFEPDPLPESIAI